MAKETVITTPLTRLPNPLITGRLPYAKVTIEVAESQEGILKLGTIVAIDDSSKKLKILKPEGSGGEEKARYILANETLDLQNDKFAAVYDFGSFYYGGLIFPEGVDKSKCTKILQELESHKIYVVQGDDDKCPTE